jgi:formylglycine-generating enzyme required for sulfatase activity
MPTTIETRVDAFELPLAIEVIGIQVTDASVIGTNATLRSGPGTAFDVVAQAAPDQLIQIAAISEDGQWYLLVSGEWIARFLVAEQPADVPVVNDQILQVIQAVTSARTPTAIATPEALATPGHFVSTVTVDANLRAGPGTEFDLLAGTVTGQEINIVGRSSDGDWFRLDNGGWVSGSLVANPPALDTVPIVNANGTPVEVVTEPTVIPKAGATQINPKDGAVLVYVIAGWFTMGSDMDQNAWDNEKPQSHLRLDAFWIMRTEVTNAQYAKCVQAGVCTEPGNTRWNDAAYAEHPVTDVSWYQASEYAQWVGGRLPTEAEWEKACRGPDKRTYTWGDAPPTKVHANFGMLVGDTTPVGSYPKRASPYGVLDMAGNVWEWTSSQFVGYPYDPNDGREDPPQSTQKVLRGGSYGDHVRYMRCAARQGFDSRDAVRSVGFRVVLPP